ncbi:FAD/NAD(P)-dependent oxidoreductase [Paraburkholderia lycopersici]|uniref:NADPH-dependent 2,4-dienoyl-CoA reductase, sulfur reductase n=1 Tax=Paraburkholderia lycopersici TaxID=416944 RepID=A0A1G6PA41_9BURK|nr:NAD(P)/FAD-dependent oxidoreductase [Paraburkholderia lycopersici]SDC77092.1 NADPH-dependent 2,4-dienoyl-CoA reductase, sulfur reductase [Paraburkholderia lycopersici]
MNGPDVLVVGGGPAGVAAAIELAKQNLSVLMVEQRSTPGGAIHRARHDGGPGAAPVARRHRRNWSRLLAALDTYAAKIDVLTETVFAGIDGEGQCLLDVRAQGRVRTLRPSAIIFAVGATEEILPRSGWELPGVVTAGGLQVQIKEIGAPTAGRIVIVGTGPLPLALASQLASLGNPPAALIESANPRRNAIASPLAALKLLARLPLLAEGVGYLCRLALHRVPRLRGYTVTQIVRSGNGMRVTAVRDDTPAIEFEADLVVLHDGLRPNDRALPQGSLHGIRIARAGDCREILGADAAIGDGRIAARRIAAELRGKTALAAEPGWRRRARMFQSALACLYRTEPPPITPDTVVCRCEGVTYAQLIDDGSTTSAREMRLLSRVGMGPCQGRFCARAASRVALEAGCDFPPDEIDGASPRWPIRPVSVEALASANEL